METGLRTASRQRSRFQFLRSRSGPSNHRRAGVQAKQHAAYHLEAGRIHQHVLRRGVYVAPASLDRTRGLRRVHPGRIRNQIARLHCEFRGRDYGEPRVRAVLDAEALAGLALAPDFIVATVEVGARRVQKALRLAELDWGEGGV